MGYHIETLKVKCDGDEACEHDFVINSNMNLNCMVNPMRICKKCGRVETIKYINEFDYLYRKFHSDVGGKNA